MALDTTNITVQEVFCKNNWELAKSKLTREIFNSFVEKITSDRLKKIFFSSGESILQKLANADISLEKKDVQFLRAVIANRSIDPKYYKFLFLEMADGNKHPYLIRQGNEVYVNIEKIISEQNGDLSKNNDNIIYYSQGRSSQGNTPFNKGDAEVVN